MFEMPIQPLTQPCLHRWWQAQNQADKGQHLEYLKVPTGIDNHMRALGTQLFKRNRLARFVGKV